MGIRNDVTPYWLDYITEFIISVLNSFDKNVQFKFEEENDETIPFVDILISWKGNDITTTVYWKSTCNNIYLSWHAFAPDREFETIELLKNTVAWML